MKANICKQLDFDISTKSIPNLRAATFFEAFAHIAVPVQWTSTSLVNTYLGIYVYLLDSNITWTYEYRV